MALDFMRGFTSGAVSATKDKAFGIAGKLGILFGEVALGGAIAFAIIMAIKKKMQYTTRVHIWKRTASGIKYRMRLGMIKVDKLGKRSLYITKPGILSFGSVRIANLEQEYLVFGEKSEELFLYQVGDLDYKPLKFYEMIREKSEATEVPVVDTEGNPIPIFDENGNAKKDKHGNVLYLMKKLDQPELCFDIVDTDANNVAADMHREIVERRLSKNKTLMVAPVVMFLIAVVAIIVLVWITLGRIESMNGAITSGMQTVAEALRDAGKQVI